MSLYEQLRPEHLRRVYGDFFHTASSLLDGIESKDRVIIINNGFWIKTDDAEEFTFRPGSGILESEMTRPLNRESLEEFLRGVEVRPEERRVTFQTGEIGRRNIEQAFEEYLREESSRTLQVMSPELIEELINYEPDRIPVHTVNIQPRRRRGASAGVWNQLRRQGDELPDSVSTTRTFLTEQEAIAYLDSLSQTTIENEENTDTV